MTIRTAFLAQQCNKIIRKLSAASLILLASCTVEQAVPGLDYRISEKAQRADWPDLVEQRRFARVVPSAPVADAEPEIDTDEGLEALQERAEALNQRAEQLGGPVLQPAERTRLLEASGALGAH